jgi:hypothetical protein
MKPIRKGAAALLLAALAVAWTPGDAWPSESLADRLSAPMRISELTDLVFQWGKSELSERRRELIGLIRDGNATQATNAALVMRRLESPFIGVEARAPDGTVSFSEDAWAIYQRMVNPDTDLDLAYTLDELLMSGSGMLFTFLGLPIQTAAQSAPKIKGASAEQPVYGPEAIAKGLGMVNVLEATARDFPGSAFAPFGEWAVGDIYLELFIYGRDRDPGFLEMAVATYDAAFQMRLSEEIGQQPEQRLFDDIGMRLAIAQTLAGDVGGAHETLDLLANNVQRNTPDRKEIDQFYIDHYLPFYGPQQDMILNTHDFIAHLRDFLDKNEPFDPNALAQMGQEEFTRTLRPFIGHLASFENRDYKVIFLSSKDLTLVAEKLEEYQTKIDKAEIDLQLEKVDGKPWHGIATPGNMTRREAERLRARLIRAGLPKDAYLWRPQTL